MKKKITYLIPKMFRSCNLFVQTKNKIFYLYGTSGTAVIISSDNWRVTVQNEECLRLLFNQDHYVYDHFSRRTCCHYVITD